MVDRKAYMAGEKLSPRFGEKPTPFRNVEHVYSDGNTEKFGTILEIPWRTYARDLLTDAGATSREIDHMLDIHDFRRIMNEIADPDVINAERAAAASLKASPTTTQEIAAASNFKLDDAPGGGVRLRDAETGREVGIFPDEAAAREYSAQAGMDAANAPVLDANASIPTDVGLGSAGGSASPPPMQAQIDMAPVGPQTRWQKFIDNVNSFASMMTGMETIARSFEKRGFGPAWSGVFEPLQKAWRQVDLEIARTARPELGGKTFQDYFKGIEKNLLRGLTKEQKADVTRYVESISRQEMEKAGGLMQRAMTGEELAAAREIVGMGLGKEMPRLIGLNSTIRNYFKNQKAFLRKAERQMKDPDISPEQKEVIRKLLLETEKMKDPLELMNFLNLSAEEVRALGMIESSFNRSKDKFSIYAVSRWAGGEDLKPGFENMRAQFAKERGLLPNQIEAAEAAGGRV